MLSFFRHAAFSFLRKEEGPTAVEYAVMLGVLVVISLTAITSLANHASEKDTTQKTAFQKASTQKVGLPVSKDAK